MAIKRYSGDRFSGMSTDIKPDNLLSGAQFTELDTGRIYTYDGTEWILSGFGADAPTDGEQYIRKDGSWEVLSLAIGDDAPSDGTQYSRKDGEWSRIHDGYTSVDQPSAPLSNLNVISQINLDEGHITGIETRELVIDYEDIQNMWVHPTGFSNQPDEIAGPLSGSTVISRILITNEGHVEGIETRELSYDDLPETPSIVGEDGIRVELNSETGDYEVNIDFANNPGLEVTEHPTTGDLQLKVKLKSQSGLNLDTEGLFIRPDIAGANLSWDNGVINALDPYVHSNYTQRDVLVDHDPNVELISRVVVDGEGHVTNVEKANMPTGEPGNVDSYTRLAPLHQDINNEWVVPLKFLPRSAKSSKVVADIAERDAIPSSERFEGLRVHVIDASGDSSVASGSAGYILASGLSNSDWVKTYEEESLDLHIPLSDGPAGRIQLSDGVGNFDSSEFFSFRSDAQRLDITGGILKKAGGTIPTVQVDESYSYVTTETVGSDTITRVMERLGDGTDVIVASYVTSA